ncbi:unannotated protein [freshwater metagenome]|uniref:Unannotated protein n=1 Tax=freshwater metagenome TaxID=449393 RepID=A0A6J6JQW1_9ZZZZ
MVTEESHRTDASTQQTPEHVTAPVIGGHNAIGHQHQRRPDVVGDDPHPNVILNMRAVASPRKLTRLIKNRPDLVNLIHVGHALLEEGDAFHAHAGVNILLGKFSDNVEVNLATHVVDQVLHEHEVPDFDIPGVINSGATVWPVLRSSVEVDLRTRASRPWLAR